MRTYTDLRMAFPGPSPKREPQHGAYWPVKSYQHPAEQGARKELKAITIINDQDSHTTATMMIVAHDCHGRLSFLLANQPATSAIGLGKMTNTRTWVGDTHGLVPTGHCWNARTSADATIIAVKPLEIHLTTLAQHQFERHLVRSACCA